MELTLDPTGYAAIAATFGKCFEAATHLAEVRWEKMSDAARDERCHIDAQMYWDWRAFLELGKIVGAKMTWPPKEITP
jgi:hypothetical protein